MHWAPQFAKASSLNGLQTVRTRDEVRARRVYNFETNSDHGYAISAFQIRAHNASSTIAGGIPVGKSMVEVRIGNTPMQLFVYKPESFNSGPMLMVFSGAGRNAEMYRDRSIQMGERFGALIVAPLFEEKQFPLEKYQHGGIVDGKIIVPPNQRTGEYINQIAHKVRLRENRENMPYALIGHSGERNFYFARLHSYLTKQRESS